MDIPTLAKYHKDCVNDLKREADKVKARNGNRMVWEVIMEGVKWHNEAAQLLLMKEEV